MSKVYKYTYQLEFEVWEPLKPEVDKELLLLTNQVKHTLDHAGKVKLHQIKEETVNGN